MRRRLDHAPARIRGRGGKRRARQRALRDFRRHRIDRVHHGSAHQHRLWRGERFGRMGGRQLHRLLQCRCFRFDRCRRRRCIRATRHVGRRLLIQRQAQLAGIGGEGFLAFAFHEHMAAGVPFHAHQPRIRVGDRDGKATAGIGRQHFGMTVRIFGFDAARRLAEHAHRRRFVRGVEHVAESVGGVDEQLVGGAAARRGHFQRQPVFAQRKLRGGTFYRSEFRARNGVIPMRRAGFGFGGGRGRRGIVGIGQ